MGRQFDPYCVRPIRRDREVRWTYPFRFRRRIAVPRIAGGEDATIGPIAADPANPNAPRPVTLLVDDGDGKRPIELGGGRLDHARPINEPIAVLHLDRQRRRPDVRRVKLERVIGRGQPHRRAVGHHRRLQYVDDLGQIGQCQHIGLAVKPRQGTAAATASRIVFACS